MFTTIEQLKGVQSIVFHALDGKREISFPKVVAEYVVKAGSVIKSIYEIEELYRVSIEKFQEFSQAITALSERARYVTQVNNEDAFKDRLQVNQKLSGLFTILRMYDEALRALFGKDDLEVLEMKGYWELSALRNYVQHVSFLPLSGTLSYELCNAEVVMVSMRFNLSRNEFKLDKLHDKTRLRVAKVLARDNLDLYEIVMGGMSAYRKIHGIIRQTKFFTDTYKQGVGYLELVSQLTTNNGLHKYRLIGQGEVIDEGDVYLYSSQLSLIKEMQTEFSVRAVYPPNKIYPVQLPASFIKQYQCAYPMNAWYKESDKCLRDYESLSPQYVVDEDFVSAKLNGIEEARKLVKGNDEMTVV